MRREDGKGMQRREGEKGAQIDRRQERKRDRVLHLLV